MRLYIIPMPMVFACISDYEEPKLIHVYLQRCDRCVNIELTGLHGDSVAFRNFGR